MTHSSIFISNFVAYFFFLWPPASFLSWYNYVIILIRRRQDIREREKNVLMFWLCCALPENPEWCFYLKIFNSITSEKALMHYKVTYLQVLKIGMGPPFRRGIVLSLFPSCEAKWSFKCIFQSSSHLEDFTFLSVSATQTLVVLCQQSGSNNWEHTV